MVRVWRTIRRVTDWKFSVENHLKEVPVIGSTTYLLKYLQARQRELSGELTFEFESKAEFDDVINDANLVSGSVWSATAPCSSIASGIKLRTN